jgi:hypothetical protein
MSYEEVREQYPFSTKNGIYSSIRFYYWHLGIRFRTLLYGILIKRLSRL